MKNKNLKLKISIFLLSTFYFLFSIFLTSAQIASQPQFVATWRSHNYAPSWYAGKIMATRGSWVDVSFDLINNGKVVDLSKNKVRWYVNDDLRRNEDDGLGIRNFYFGVDEFARDDIEVRIVIVDYAENEIGKMIIIPLVSPEAVVDAPYSNRQLPNGTNFFKVYPFFFNVNDLSKLSFNWIVGGRLAESNAIDTSILKLNIDKLAPSGFGIDIQATINNLTNEMEFASSRVKMEVR